MNSCCRDRAVAEEEAGAGWVIEGELRQTLNLNAEFGGTDSDVADLIHGRRAGQCSDVKPGYGRYNFELIRELFVQNLSY